MIERFRSLPMARSAVLAGRTLGDAVRNTLVVLLMTVVGVLIGFRLHAGVLAALAALVCSWSASASPSPGSRPPSASPSTTSSRPRRPGSSGCSR